MNHEEFERTVMNMLLEGTDPRFVILKRQYLSSKIINRDFTGYGFFTKFNVPDDLIDGSFSGRINDLYANITDGDHKCLEKSYLIFILYVTDGKIDTLECFTTLEGIWDYNYNNIAELKYFYEDRREFELN